MLNHIQIRLLGKKWLNTIVWKLRTLSAVGLFKTTVGGIKVCEEKQFRNPAYDGSDISRKCADVIKTKAYEELDDYLVYLQDNKLVRVSKKNGEEKDIAVDVFWDFKYNVCAWKDRVYFVNCADYAKYICSINVQTMEEEKIECIGEASDNVSDRKLQANGNYVIYSTSIENKRRIACYNSKDKTTTVLSLLNPADKHEMKVSNFYLAGNDLYFKVLYCYNEKLPVSG